MKNSFLFIVLTLFLTSNICAGKLSDIKVFNSNGDYVTYKVEIVTSPEEQEKGLMFRDKLKIKEGMLLKTSAAVIFLLIGVFEGSSTTWNKSAAAKESPRSDNAVIFLSAIFFSC